jgi:arsenite methyltransferase
VARNPVRRIGEDVTELFAHPGGWAARPMVHALNFFNRRGNRLVASALGTRPGDRVLEVGFGGGAAMPTTIAALDGRGLVCGLDLSEDMARLAAARFQAKTEEVTPTFACGDVESLPLRSRAFDRAYAMHSHLYWPSPLRGIREMRRVVRPHGRVLLGMDVVSGVRLVRWFGRGYKPPDTDELQRLVREAGFSDVSTRKLTGGVVAVIGTRA